jgi:hypothetical protein
MKASVSVEFTDDELRKHAEAVFMGLLLRFVRESTARFGPGLIYTMFQQAFEMGVHDGQTQRPTAPRNGPVAGGGPAARTGPFHVRRDVGPAEGASGAPMTVCLRIEEGAHIEEGWCCHLCGGYNGVQRQACRNCKHERCDVIIPPAPEPSPPEAA